MQKNVVPAFIRGLDGKTPPGLRAVGSLDICENFVIEKGSELGLQLRKRYGTSSITATTDTGASLATARKLKSYGSELLQLTDDRLYSRSVGASKWYDRGACPSFTLLTTPDVDNAATQTTADCVYVNGLRVLAWEDSRGGVRYSVIDQTTNQAIVNDALLDASASLPRLVVSGTCALLFYITSSTLTVRKITSTMPASISGAVSIVAAGGSPIWHDEIAIANDRVAYLVQTGAGAQQVGFIDSTLVVSAAPAPLNRNVPMSYASLLPGSSAAAGLFAAYWDSSAGGTIAFIQYDVTGLNILQQRSLDVAAGTVRNLAGYVSGGVVTVLYEQTAGTSYNTVIKKATWNGIAATALFKRSVGLASCAFQLGANWHVALAYDSPDQPTNFVTNIATGDIVARIHPEIGSGLTAKAGRLPNVSAPTTSSVLFACLRRTQVAITNTGAIYTPTGVNTVTLTAGDHALGSPEEFASGVVIPSACPRFYDGAQTVEAGFHLFPQTPGAPTQATGGALTTTGVYQYLFGWEWIDRAGQRHRSTLSYYVNVTLTSTNQQLTFTIPTDRLTSRASVALVVWRTKAGQNTFYRASSMTSPTLNDPTVDSITWNDQMSDVTLGNGEPLFSTLDPMPPPASRVACVWKNRVWIGGTDDVNYLYPSLELSPGYGPAWSDALKVRIDTAGGAVTALAGFDDFLIAFKSSSAYYISGDGPDANGRGSFWAVPLRLPSAVGTIDPDSIVRIPAGVAFKSPKGWYVITRSLDVQYLAAADDFAGLTVTGAMVDDSSDLVRWTTASGTTVCYDLTFGKFLAHTNQYAVAATKWQGLFCYLDASGVVHQETSGSYGDDGAFVRSRAVLSFASLAGWLGRGRIFRAQVKGEYRGKHGLLIKAAYDGGAQAESFTRDVDATLGVTTYGTGTPYGAESPFGVWDGSYAWDVRPARQRMTSLSLSVEDYSSDGTASAAFALTGIGFEVGVDAGLNRRAASRRAVPG